MNAGLYQLVEDIPNPQPDKRTKYDWTLAPVFKKGTYRIQIYEGHPLKELTTVGISVIPPSLAKNQRMSITVSNINDWQEVLACRSVHKQFTNNDERFFEIVRNLKPIQEPTLSDLLNENYYTTRIEDVLAYLFVNKKISIEQVREACKQVEAMTEEQQTEMLKQSGIE